MNKHIIERVLTEAKYICDTKATVRDTAVLYRVSKSTVHKDLQDRLKELDELLHTQVKDIFDEHIMTRHIKGGESTKIKYAKLKE